jgi:hypothetical protein
LNRAAFDFKKRPLVSSDCLQKKKPTGERRWAT